MCSCIQVGLKLHRMTTEGAVDRSKMSPRADHSPHSITSIALKYWSEERGSGLIDYGGWRGTGNVWHR